MGDFTVLTTENEEIIIKSNCLLENFAVYTMSVIKTKIPVSGPSAVQI